ncbi:MAG: nucleotidyltransferase domain-containing protein [Chthoniobacteraceae bacterium]|nr:nucleotidyltransferase domain-containing protein [Chthoniobacteraceae bacterium]
MEYTAKEREILDQVTAALHGHYGERLSRVVLFGSRARRDHREDSDYDILVVLKGPLSYRKERPELSDLVYPICWEHDVVIYGLAVSEEDYHKQNLPLMINVREEGVTL